MVYYNDDSGLPNTTAMSTLAKLNFGTQDFCMDLVCDMAE